jgi:hypothetical protein
MKVAATSTVQNAACQVEQRVRSLRQQAGAEGDRSANALNLFVQNRPFVALTIAVGADRRARARALSQPSTGSFARIAVFLLITVLCAVAALCRGLGAPRIYTAPILGAAGALCAASAVLCAVGLFAFGFKQRVRETRVRSSVPDLRTWCFAGRRVKLLPAA